MARTGKPAPLLDAAPFGVAPDEARRRILRELNNEFRYQYDSCALFRKVADSFGWDPEKPSERLEDLPYLPVQYFKEAGRLLVSISNDTRHRLLHSSGTSGRHSTVVLDQETARRQTKALVSTLGDFIGKERRRFIVCDVPPAPGASHELSARAAAMTGFLSFARSRTYILKTTQTGGFEIDFPALESFFDEMSRDPTPVCLAGFTVLLYTALLEPLQGVGKSFSMPPGTVIIHIGGWKKLKDRAVDRITLAQAARDVFDVPAEAILDIYGFTEQMGTIHVECRHGRKHAPAFADVLVRDPTTLSPLPDNAVGLGQFLSTVPHSYPGFSVLTDDLVRVTGRKDCPCGRQGTTFEVLGRDDGVELRGCGDILAEKVLVSAPDSRSRPAPGAAGDTRPSDEGAADVLVLFRAGAAHYRFASTADAPGRLDDWGALERELGTAQKRLQNLPVDDVMSVLHAACETWAERDGPFAEYHRQGLSFIVNFIRSGRLQAMTDESLRGGRGVLDRFHHDPTDTRRLRAVPRGIVAHWLAGNVPTLGIISLLLTLVTKNANVVKVASDSPALLPEMLATIAAAEGRSPGGRVVSGRTVAEAVAVIYLPASSPAARRLSMLADVRIAWGGAEAVRAIMALPRRYDAEDIIFGPKLSLAAVGREALESESRAKRVARGVATDCSVFDQEACASAHCVYVEKGGAVAPERFAELLAGQMEATAKRIPGAPPSAAVAAAVKSARIQHLVSGKVFAPRGLEWTVLYRDDPARPDPVFGRTAQVRAVDDLAQVAPHIDRGTQVVGLALPASRRAEIAELYGNAGADRIAQVGHMADFAAPWDGMFPMERLVRWVSLT